MSNGHLPGYAECHFCTVKKKRRALRCVACVGKAGIAERLARSAEDGLRRKAASLMSLLVPGSGHLYRSSPGTGLFFMVILSIAAAYMYFINIENVREVGGWLLFVKSDYWTSGMWFLVGSMLIVYVIQALDAARGPGERTPPCQEACPSELACMKYVNLAREGKFAESLEIIQVNCPFPGAVGRVCHHPCEQNCRRGTEGDAVGICAIKRYLADNASAKTKGFYAGEIEGDRKHGEKVAVVGGGPSGLSAALYLRMLGFGVTVFEARDKLGGMPALVIPDYRLPGVVYSDEIDRITSLGVEVRFGQRLGGNLSLDDLKKDGFAAAYVALGAQRSFRLPHCGKEEEGFLDGLEVLEMAKNGTAPALKGHVIVIGGGNVAVDVAKTAVRLGADSVKKIFLETRETMPAHHWECEEAEEEGVQLMPAGSTVSFEMENGRVRAAKCRKVARIDFDENGRIKPVLEEGSDFTLPADWVITAVGTGPDYSVFEKPPKMKPLRRGCRTGRLPADIYKGIPVVVGGDFFAGPSSVIDAIAAGKEGAKEIYRLLGKRRIFRAPSWNRMKAVRYPNYPDEPGKAARVHPVKVDPEVRCESFCEICETYGALSAEEEAARCLRCSWPMHPVKRRRQDRRRTVPAPG
jgi:formate dehydrogenase major subunit